MEIHAGIVMENVCDGVQARCHMAGCDLEGEKKSAAVGISE